MAFAALTMNDDIHLSSFEYGLGSGLFFFLGYIIFQVNLHFSSSCMTACPASLAERVAGIALNGTYYAMLHKPDSGA